MTRMQNSLRSPSMPNTENANHHTSRPVYIQPSINHAKETSSKDGARAAPGISRLVEQNVFVNNSASAASVVQKTINLSRNLTTATAKGISVAASIGVKVPASIKAVSPSLTKFGVQAKVAEIPFRVLTTLKDIKGQSVTDGITSSIKLATATTEAAADVGNWMTTPKKGSAPTTMRPPFQRGQSLSSNSFKMKPLRNSSHATTPSAAGMSPAGPSQFYPGRGGPLRLPVRVRPLPPPRLPALTPRWRSVSTSGTTKTSFVATTLSRIGNGAKLLGGGADLYFGVKQVTQERESAGKAQGVLTAASGVAGTVSGAASLVGTFGIAGAATASAGLAVASYGLSVVALGMTAIPTIHGRDNKNRAIKLYNDFSHEVKQVEAADKQLSQRIKVDLEPTLQGLEDCYGIQTKTVWLNNNAADLLNQVNSPNNTTSGQWKPDGDGNVWSNFDAKYIRIEGTPHQDKVVLNLPKENNGARLVAAADCVITVPGEKVPEKRAVTVKSLAADPELHNVKGWSGSTAQASVSKHYGYQTSAWGQHWETDVPLAVDAGPSYLSHAVSSNGQDTVVLINDTSIERPEKSVPESDYTEAALFAHDDKDGERLTARQVASLAWAGKPATIDGKFNVAESAEKARENAYRQAVYPCKDGVPYIRSPDAFTRVIKTNPEHRTVVSLQNITHPTRLALQNAGDIVDIPGELGQDVTISLPRLPVGAVDERRLGIAYHPLKPRLMEQSSHAGKGGKNVIHVSTYTLGNGATLTVQATDRSHIENLMNRSS